MAKDTVGIISYVSTLLAEREVNIMDMSQTLMQEYFTMIMLVEIPTERTDFEELRAFLKAKGEERNLVIRIQREDIFNAMHRI
jgi:ACT domain-containing protein